MDMGSRSRCRRKTLTIHKSGFQPLFSPSTPFFLSVKATLAAQRPMRSSVLPPSWRRPYRVGPCRLPADRCCLTLPPACSRHRVPAHARGPRALCLRMGTCFRAGAGVGPHRNPTLCPEKENGICISACISAAPSTIVLRAMRVYKSGSPPEGLFSPGPARSQRSSYTGVSGVKNGVRIS